jgi:homoserine acetyltransferase
MIATNDRSTSVTKKPFCTTTTTEETEDDANTASTSSNTVAMEDEYGEMTAEGESYLHPEPFVLESGQILPHATLKYQTYGNLNEARDNVLVVCHALTGAYIER